MRCLRRLDGGACGSVFTIREPVDDPDRLAFKTQTLCEVRRWTDRRRVRCTLGAHRGRLCRRGKEFGDCHGIEFRSIFCGYQSSLRRLEISGGALEKQRSNTLRWCFSVTTLCFWRSLLRCYYAWSTCDLIWPTTVKNSADGAQLDSATWQSLLSCRG